MPLDVLAGPIPDAQVQQIQPYAMEVKSKLEDAFETARKYAGGEQRRQKKLYGTWMYGSPYKTGDNVRLYCPERFVGLSPKLRSHWKGPCTIIKTYSDANYLIKVPNVSRTRQVVHFDRLKPCTLREDDNIYEPIDQHTASNSDNIELPSWNDNEVPTVTGHIDGDFETQTNNEADASFCNKPTRVGRLTRPPFWMKDFVV